MPPNLPKLLSLLASWGGPPGPQPTPASARWDWMKLILFTEERIQGDPRRPGGLPHRCVRYEFSSPRSQEYLLVYQQLATKYCQSSIDSANMIEANVITSAGRQQLINIQARRFQ